jgi:serine/threonine protein phosphatase 1
MPRERLAFEAWPAAVYAVGDVHGCLDQLIALERQILADGRRIAGEKWIVMLGDYIDRGPNSAGVIEHLRHPPEKGWRRFCLLGNHEQMMLDFLADADAHAYWLEEGGIATLQSYAAEQGSGGAEGDEISIPSAHLQFLMELPIWLRLPGWLFVHAGIRPGVPLEAQEDDDLVFIRRPFLEASDLGGVRVVHGHTPAPAPMATPTRIGIDTHCFRSGRLTAVRIMPDGETKFFTASG